MGVKEAKNIKKIKNEGAITAKLEDREKERYIISPFLIAKKRGLSKGLT
jgi:hypothetical protein